jgi:hypothetical protein
MSDDRDAVLRLLRDGKCTMSEAADLIGVNRATVLKWARAGGIDPQATRQALLLKLIDRSRYAVTLWPSADRLRLRYGERPTHKQRLAHKSSRSIPR